MRLALDLPSAALTAEEFDALPTVEGFRLELWEGNIIVMSAAQFGWHSWVVDQMVAYFREQSLPTMREVGVKVAPRDVPNPDVMVLGRPLTPADLDRSQFGAADVVRVVEVVSEESKDRDTLTKPAKYAAARIPEYWLVERHPTDQVNAIISIFKLTPAGNYEISTRYDLSQLRPLRL